MSWNDFQHDGAILSVGSPKTLHSSPAASNFLFIFRLSNDDFLHVCEVAGLGSLGFGVLVYYSPWNLPTCFPLAALEAWLLGQYETGWIFAWNPTISISSHLENVGVFRFPSMGVPQVIIHSKNRSFLNHPAIGVAPRCGSWPKSWKLPPSPTVQRSGKLRRGPSGLTVRLPRRKRTFRDLCRTGSPRKRLKVTVITII